jgi:arylsulfatase A-like enzyme
VNSRWAWHESMASKDLDPREAGRIGGGGSRLSGAREGGCAEGELRLRPGMRCLRRIVVRMQLNMAGLSLTSALALGCLSAGVPNEGPDSLEQPNIVLFMVDDLGWQDTSVALHSESTAFNNRYRTPNVERLAREGVSFTNAYAAAPVCTPTRTSLMTGQDPARTHITFWTLNKDRDTSKSHPTLDPPKWSMNGLGAGQATLPGQLAAAGYHTIHVGKAHFGAHDTSGADPIALGFDVNIAGHASGAPASFYGTHNFSQAGRTGKPATGKSVWDVPGLEKYHGKDVYLTEALVSETLPAMRSAHASGKPFFLHFATYAVHAPIMANKKLLDHYPDLDAREAAYATMVETYDNALGDLLAELDELGIADETMVIFASDNGGLSAHARGGEPHIHNAPLRSGKGSAYEGGVRVPTLVRWPGVAQPRRRVDTPISTPDLFTTILLAASAEIPKQDEQTVDGVDITPLLRGASEEFQARTLGWHQPHQWGAKGPGIEPFTSIREGDWKLIWFHGRRRFELYDLSKDIGERNDLAQSIPGRVLQLADVMQSWIDDRGAQLSIKAATGKPILGPAAVARGLH